MNWYHASPIKDLTTLDPRISNHGVPLVYLSKKRENVLVYLSNAVEKYCKETGFEHHGKWSKWGPYGFDKNGILQLEEYYPNALEETYKGVAGYVYMAKDIKDSGYCIGIPDAGTSSVPVPICACEYIPDAYDEILTAENKGLISLIRYENQSQKKIDWICKTVIQEYKVAEDQLDYRHFLEGKFKDVFENVE